MDAEAKRMAFGIESVSMRSKLLWTIFALTQMIGAWGAFYYSPHGSRALFVAFCLLLPGSVLALLLLRDSLGYISFLACAIPLNLVVWYGCAWLFRRIRRGAFKGSSKQA